MRTTSRMNATAIQLQSTNKWFNYFHLAKKKKKTTGKEGKRHLKNLGFVEWWNLRTLRQTPRKKRIPDRGLGNHKSNLVFYARITFRVHLKLLFSLEMFFYCGGFGSGNCVCQNGFFSLSIETIAQWLATMVDEVTKVGYKRGEVRWISAKCLPISQNFFQETRII